MGLHFVYISASKLLLLSLCFSFHRVPACVTVHESVFGLELLSDILYEQYMRSLNVSR